MMLETLDRALQKTMYWHHKQAMERPVSMLTDCASRLFASQSYDVLMAIYLSDFLEADNDRDERRLAAALAAIALALSRRTAHDVELLAPGLELALRTALTNSAFAKYSIFTDDINTIRGSEWIRAHGADLVNGLNDYTRDRLSAVLADGFRSGATVDEIASRIVAEFEDMRWWRARKIAVTETNRAWSYAEIESAREMERAGYVMVKEWLLGPYHPKYDLCDTNHEQGAIPINQTFPSGDFAPPQHPSCGCSLITYPSSDYNQPIGAIVLGYTPLMPFTFGRKEGDNERRSLD